MQYIAEEDASRHKFYCINTIYVTNKTKNISGDITSKIDMRIEILNGSDWSDAKIALCSFFLPLEIFGLIQLSLQRERKELFFFQRWILYNAWKTSTKQCQLSRNNYIWKDHVVVLSESNKLASKHEIPNEPTAYLPCAHS